jgi:hypothetical protein
MMGVLAPISPHLDLLGEYHYHLYLSCHSSHLLSSHQVTDWVVLLLLVEWKNVPCIAIEIICGNIDPEF